MMAAVIFVLTMFVRIEIPTPTGYTNLKIANGFCLAAGMLFGGVYGGLAAGVGSMLFDVMDPKYITSAPFTFAFFFLMAFVCGCMYPAYFFPETLQIVGQYLPAGAARVLMANCLTGGYTAGWAWLLLGYSAVFLLLTAAVRLYAVRSDRR